MTDVVLPCLDEAVALPWVLSRIPTGYRAIVADNGSTDGSADIARRQPGDRGVRAAARLRLRRPHRTTRRHRRGRVLLDADGSFDPAQLPRVVDPVAAGDADLAVGRRRPTTRRAWPVHARLANAVLAWWLRTAIGVPMHDLGPMRAARRTGLLDLNLRDRRFGYPLEMVVAAARAGWRISEVDVDYAPRTAGTRSKVTGTVRGTARAIGDMAKVLAAR
jgi:glycosyltransferase involved in cell wall biosynthesis